MSCQHAGAACLPASYTISAWEKNVILSPLRLRDSKFDLKMYVY